ncbi:MAG: polyketide cyclase [Anaeromyxobacteraceae bacterium]|nr:polyketide cyclase [Anaeromyxobacteraceae bacterium]
MTNRSPVVHSTFRIERSYPVSPARVFAAFADPAAKRRWFVEGEGWDVGEHSLDFRVGGRERSRFRFRGGPPQAPPPGTEMGNDTTYQDIVPDERIVFAYTMTVAGRCISASLATVELAPDGAGTRLAFTEQAAFFEGADGEAMREQGWRALLEALARDLGRP